jgi:DNA-binding LacI/PurR family transcriptional regulator
MASKPGTVTTRRVEPDPEPEPTARRTPTLETVARLAGVSRATVSRVVNGDTRVAERLRVAVDEAIQVLGFVPNAAARSLATRRTGSVALIMREPADFGVTDAYLSRMVVALSHALTDVDLQLVVLMAAGGEADARVAAYARSHVDGVFLISVHDSDELPSQLAGWGVPLVIGGRTSQHLPGATSVDVDNVAGAGLAGRRLLQRGRHRLGLITGPVDTCSSNDREAGFRRELEVAGVPLDHVAHGDWTAASGERTMRELLDAAPDLDGVFAASDLMAMGALHAAAQAGRSVPGDVAVVGFDDIDMAAHTAPPLTTVRQPSTAQARRMVEILVDKIAGKETPASEVLDVELVGRDSA